MALTNFTKFFTTEADVYVANCSSCQVVVQFDLGGGQTTSFTFAPNRDPVNLTQHVPFNAIKNSVDFRKILNRVPAVVTLLTEEEYLGYYQTQAKSKGLASIDKAIDLAEHRRSNRSVLPDAPSPINLAQEEETQAAPVQLEDAINSRILNLCLQVHPSVPDPQKMTAQQMLSELESMDSLKRDDYEYVVAHGLYKTVINYAKKKMSAAEPVRVIDDTVTDDVRPTKKKVAAKVKKTEPKVTTTIPQE